METTAPEHHDAGGERIVLDHGSGARLSRDLIALIVDWLGDVHAAAMEDSAVLDIPAVRVAVTTGSVVVTPNFVGIGDIGRLAVCGTVNAIAVSGAGPLPPTLGLILETGLPLAELRRVVTSIRDAASAAGVTIV